MSTKTCCKTCQHCCLGQATSDGWCRLRRIRVHSDIAVFALCHHWTKRAPSLPTFDDKNIDDVSDQQLEFDRDLVVSDKY